MNDEFSNIINTEEPVGKNNFPILTQLGVLGVIMIVLFGVLLLPKTQPNPAPVNTQPIVIDNTQNPQIPQKLGAVNIHAKAAYVWDVQSQRALYSKNADTALPLASITKLMTALLAYELIEDSEEATISLSAIQQEGSSGFSAGERLGIKELRKIALISSSNDAAYALAASVGSLLGDNNPTDQFVSGMNIRASELGLGSLVFKNTTGLDLTDTEPGAVGSARDISFLMEYIITHHPEIISPTQEGSTRVYNTNGAYHDINNTNQVALDIPNMIGSKTGYTDLAGGNLTIAFDAGLNRPIIVTVLGSTHDQRFSDILTLVAAVQDSIGKPE